MMWFKDNTITPVRLVIRCCLQHSMRHHARSLLSEYMAPVI